MPLHPGNVCPNCIRAWQAERDSELWAAAGKAVLEVIGESVEICLESFVITVEEWIETHSKPVLLHVAGPTNLSFHIAKYQSNGVPRFIFRDEELFAHWWVVQDAAWSMSGKDHSLSVGNQVWTVRLVPFTLTDQTYCVSVFQMRA